MAQVGCPPSVAALRQRLGRSGRRRGKPSTLRLYLSEEAITLETPFHDTLRAELVQAIAMVELLLARWCEAPHAGQLHLSTLIQQLLSMLAQPAATLVETSIVVESRYGAEGVRALDLLLASASIHVVPVDAAQAQVARAAFA